MVFVIVVHFAFFKKKWGKIAKNGEKWRKTGKSGGKPWKNKVKSREK